MVRKRQNSTLARDLAIGFAASFAAGIVVFLLFEKRLTGGVPP